MESSFLDGASQEVLAHMVQSNDSQAWARYTERPNGCLQELWIYLSTLYPASPIVKDQIQSGLQQLKEYRNTKIEIPK